MTNKIRTHLIPTSDKILSRDTDAATLEAALLSAMPQKQKALDWETTPMDPTVRNNAPEKLKRQEFGRRVYTLMLRKGWRQSELSRRADLPRDSISAYVRGKRTPTPTSLEKLAAALDTSANELWPDYVAAAIEDDEPSVEMKVSPSAPQLAWLRINRQTSLSTAVKIIEMLEADDVATGK